MKDNYSSEGVVRLKRRSLVGGLWYVFKVSPAKLKWQAVKTCYIINRSFSSSPEKDLEQTK